MYDFEGKVALVTGASGGIGRATAIAFARNGASVVASDVDDGSGNKTVELIREFGGKAIYHHCDVSNAVEVKALVAKAVSEFGRLDFAHNNAGINNPLVSEYEDEVWARCLAVNLTSVMLCMREEVEVMPKGDGAAIVNTASTNGLVGQPRQPGYTATKHGVVGLTRHAALRHATAGIRVNCVCPGVIETPMTTKLFSIEGIRDVIEKMTPMGRFGQPEEVAGAVLWLCSSQSSFVTGHALVVDGGATAI